MMAARSKEQQEWSHNCTLDGIGPPRGTLIWGIITCSDFASHVTKILDFYPKKLEIALKTEESGPHLQFWILFHT